MKMVIIVIIVVRMVMIIVQCASLLVFISTPSSPSSSRAITITTGSYMMTVPRMLVLNIVIGPDLMAIVLVTIPLAQTHRMEDGEVVDEKSEQPLITNFNYGHS